MVLRKSLLSAAFLCVIINNYSTQLQGTFRFTKSWVVIIPGWSPGEDGEKRGAWPRLPAGWVGPVRHPLRLPRLGAPLGAFHASLLHCLLPQLSSPRLAVRKRAVGALGHLAAACSTDLFVELADHLLDRLPGPRAPTSPAAVRTLIQCLGSVGRQAGHRLGKGVSRLCKGLVTRWVVLGADGWGMSVSHLPGKGMWPDTPESGTRSWRGSGWALSVTFF